MAPSTVFVVEDDVDTRDMLGRFLELEGFQVEVAANGRQALDRLTSGVHPCVILLDLMMPVMDGYGVLAELAKDPRTTAVPVLVLSARAIPEEAERATKAGARRFLEKPFDPEDLANELAEMLRVD